MRIVALVFLLLAIGGCYSASQYRGDGTLIDRGISYPIRRYDLSLGEIDLARVGEWTFHAENLPRRRYVFGIEANLPNCSALSDGGEILVEVTNEAGQIVIQESRSLGNFEWSLRGSQCATRIGFGYASGKAREFALREGGSCSVPIYSGADEGHGTIFTTRPEAKYVFTIKVRSLSSDSSLNIARVLLHDDGQPAKDSDRCEKRIQNQ